MKPRLLTADVLVIGAGPAGCLAAAQLRRAGLSVIVVEREYFPRFVIGESLLTRCNELLHEAGLLTAIEARGYNIKRGVSFRRNDEENRICFADGLSGDWPTSFQVPRDDFDQTLATAVRGMGADLYFGQEVQAASTELGRALLPTRDLESGETSTFEGKMLLDCSGYGRVLARLFELELASPLPSRAACFTHVFGDVRDEGDRAGDIWVVSHPDGGWMWVIPFSNGRTSVGWVGDTAALDARAGTDRERLRAIIEEDPNVSLRMAQAAAVLPTRRIAGYSRKIREWYGPGWVIAGNAGDFLDPVFSSGVALAMESASIAARLTVRQLAGETVDWEGQYRQVMQSAVGVFRGMVEAWYRGDLPELIYASVDSPAARSMITSVLSGYALNPRNPLVRDTPAMITGLLRQARAPAGAQGR